MAEIHDFGRVFFFSILREAVPVVLYGVFEIMEGEQKGKQPKTRHLDKLLTAKWTLLNLHTVSIDV